MRGIRSTIITFGILVIAGLAAVASAGASTPHPRAYQTCPGSYTSHETVGGVQFRASDVVVKAVSCPTSFAVIGAFFSKELRISNHEQCTEAIATHRTCAVNGWRCVSIDDAQDFTGIKCRTGAAAENRTFTFRQTEPR